MVEKHLEQLGFNETEVKVYLALADVGKSTAQLLGKRAGVPRTTAYSTLDNLVRKGVVAIEQKRGSTFYTANNPAALLKLVEQDKREVLAREHVAKELVQLIQPYFRNKNFSIPKLQFFEGRKNVASLLRDNLDTWRESLRQYDNAWWGYQDHTFVEEYIDWLEESWVTKSEDEYIKLISNYSKVESALSGKVKGRKIIPVSKEYNFSSSIWVCGDFIVLLMTRQEPHYAFQLHDPVFSANLRLVFQLLWGVLSKEQAR